MTVALILGTVLAVAALAFVLYPLFFGNAVPRQSARGAQPARDARAADEETAVAALREIEFDRATGKLSDTDYAELKERYTRQALAAMRMRQRAAVTVGAYAPPDDDELEAAVLAYRASHPECPVCGPRPEADAVFCSSCGRYLRGACPACGRSIEATGARFCPDCGHTLAA